MPSMSIEKDISQQLSYEDLKVAHFADCIFEGGFATLESTVLAGVHEKYNYLVEGLSTRLISGDAEFSPGAQVWETRGRHLVYNPDRLQIVEDEEFQKGNFPPGETVVFSGEIVSREGPKGLEVLRTLFAIIPVKK